MMSPPLCGLRAAEEDGKLKVAQNPGSADPAMPLVAPSLTLGLEEEYLLVDPASYDLVASPPEGFMACCQQRLGERVTYELLQAQVEVGTSVCRDVARGCGASSRCCARRSPPPPASSAWR